MNIKMSTMPRCLEDLRIEKQEKRKGIEEYLHNQETEELQSIVDNYHSENNILMRPLVWIRDILIDPDEYFEYCKAYEIINIRQKQEKPKQQGYVRHLCNFIRENF